VGLIYFVEADGSGLIKIGYTDDNHDPRSRLKQLETGCPFPLKLLGCVRGDRRKEGTLHRQFASYRSHLEWFFPGKGLLTYIRDHARRLNPNWETPEALADRALDEAIRRVRREQEAKAREKARDEKHLAHLQKQGYFDKPVKFHPEVCIFMSEWKRYEACVKLMEESAD
jgi:hypothetical protein